MNYVIVIDDAAKTTQIGYNTGSGFTQTATGSYTRTDSEISLTSSAPCPGVVGNYTYHVTSSSLTFTVVADVCTDGSTMRKDVIGNGNWVRQ